MTTSAPGRRLTVALHPSPHQITAGAWTGTALPHPKTRPPPAHPSHQSRSSRQSDLCYSLLLWIMGID